MVSSLPNQNSCPSSNSSPSMHFRSSSVRLLALTKHPAYGMHGGSSSFAPLPSASGFCEMPWLSERRIPKGQTTPVTPSASEGSYSARTASVLRGISAHYSKDRLRPSHRASLSDTTCGFRSLLLFPDEMTDRLAMH